MDPFRFLWMFKPLRGWPMRNGAAMPEPRPGSDNVASKRSSRRTRQSNASSNSCEMRKKMPSSIDENETSFAKPHGTRPIESGCFPALQVRVIIGRLCHLWSRMI
jgi:hypothetical protein